MQHPLQNHITNMQIYNARHYITLIITDNKYYYYYDGLNMTVPNIAPHLHDRLRQWYGNSPKPHALQRETPLIYTPYTPQKTDDRSCAMYMILTSLSTIYQGHLPILELGQRHVDQLSRMHLRCVLTGDLTPWIDKLITYITDTLNNNDPEPYSKPYNAGL